MSTEDVTLAKPNYSFEKRQRELAKKQKKEEKLRRKTLPGEAPEDDEAAEPDAAATDAAPEGDTA
ncbi:MULTISPECIES: hypothetical protein [Uliginosibacterium]|uniref:Uncharacterized protein n=1 Tax=Uliginosibacterium aquaticum TaxID=2731212 RepID=A0ABX2IHK4_9RHOO|nr:MULTISPECIES: hypothetical protein [Uliginosibacterium]NSL53580.1 hypothetical protein [Uliginosibacterium aquaticum]PLK49302.1 hypothetical protein C0V76_08895 [Uliginosibacterium sp. TH139]